MYRSNDAGVPHEPATANVCLTEHARMRMQQRGISSAALDILFELGDVSEAPGGQQIVLLGRSRRKELGRRGKSVRERDRLKRLYAIMDHRGTVITVGHRYRRTVRI